MRKRLVADPAPPAEAGWLDLARLATAEVTSEDPAHPVEAALVPPAGGSDAAGWRAAGPGPQTLRLVFDAPVRVRRVALACREDAVARTQEFVLRWSADGGASYREAVRQQFTFSPPGTREESEDYETDLAGVTALELHLVPDIGRSGAVASVAWLRVAGG